MNRNVCTKGLLQLFLASYLAFSLAACQTDTGKSNKRITEINAVPNAAEMIRNPISANGVEDTINVAKLNFVENRFDFGTVDEGEKVSRTYNFTNAGKVPLIISDARSTCGCTVPKWPSAPILPGESGQIDVVFNTAGKKNKQSKPITVTANTYPSRTILQLEGIVTPSRQKLK